VGGGGKAAPRCNAAALPVTAALVGVAMLPMSMGMPMMPLPFLSRMNNKSNGEVFVKARGGYKCGRCGTFLDFLGGVITDVGPCSRRG
jgi:hypothetical protein